MEQLPRYPEADLVTRDDLQSETVQLAVVASNIRVAIAFGT